MRFPLPFIFSLHLFRVEILIFSDFWHFKIRIKLSIFLTLFNEKKREKKSKENGKKLGYFFHISFKTRYPPTMEGTPKTETTLTVTGWVEKIQPFKKHSFLFVRDPPRKYQVVVVGSLLPDRLSQECYVEITGVKKRLPEGYTSFCDFEIHCTSQDIRVISDSKGDFSMRCPPDAGPELRLTERHFYLRDPKFVAITRLRTLLIRAIRDHFEGTDCTEIFPPSFVGNQCEGGATLFKLKHPGKSGSEDVDAYLTQSSQFYLEYALPALGDCFCIAPSFRAEKSHTRRHLTEFLHAECEWSGILKFEDHLQKLRELVQGILFHLGRLAHEDESLFKILGIEGRFETLRKMAQDIQVMTHADAITYCREHEIYKDEDGKVHFDKMDDIPEAAERKMIDQIGKIVFLTKFPKVFKSFYMKSCPDDCLYVQGCDVEVPGVGEVIGSGVRVSDPRELKKRLKEEGLREEDYREYIELREYGFGMTSGMGLGVDRFLTWILGTHSIRDVVTFPRFPGHLTP